MKHLAIICAEFLKSAVDRDWWKKLSPQEQQQYILQHKKTKLRPTNLDQSSIETNQSNMQRLFSIIPKNWKNTLIYEGVGENSNVERLSDALRPRAIKQALEDESAIAIVAFKAGTPITDMKPEFIITKVSYEPEKFNCKRLTDNVGNIIDQNSNDAYVSEITESYRRGVISKYKKTDLRISKIIDKLPDEAYTVFAIKTDPERFKLKQMRGESTADDNYRTIEKTLIAKTVKPVFDYYSYNLQNSYDQLKNIAVPSFEDIMNADPYARDTNADKIEKIMENIKIFRSRLNSLNYHIRSAQREHLPTEGRPYKDENDSDWNKRKVHKFLDEIKKLKQNDDLKNDFDRAVRFKKRLAIESLQKNKFEDAADLLDDINMKKLSDKIKQLSSMTDKSKVNVNDLADEIQNTEV
jgi:hypothetical protein